jgi:pSer/pThr/pTyr-binding forkhead associated (FHA) protein
MNGVFRVVSGPDAGRVFHLTEDQTLLIGRGQTTQTRLHDPLVSRVHCVAEFTGGKVTLTDSGSSAGTLVNGRAIAQRELEPGDLIRIGDTQLSFQWAETGTGYSTIGLELPPGPPSPPGA